MPKASFRRKKLTTLSGVGESRRPDVVAEIYKSNKGQVLDLKKIQKTSKGFPKILLILLVLPFLAGLALLGFFVFSPTPEVKFGEEMVELTLTAPSEVTAAEEFSYTMEYQNKSEIPLTNLEVVFSPPAGFVSLSNEFSWSVKRLAPDESQTRTFTGQLFGKEADVKTARVTMLFTPEKFRSEFRRSEAATTTIMSSSLILSLESPSEILVGEEFPVRFMVKNTASRDLHDVAVILRFGETLVPVRADPIFNKTVFNESSWIIETLGAGAEWQGEFFASASEMLAPLMFDARLGILVNDEVFIVQEEPIPLKVSKEDLLVKVFVNGSDQGSTVNFAERLNASFVVKNLGETDVRDLEAEIVLDETGGTLLRWEAFESSVKVKPEATPKGLGRVSRFSVTKKHIKQLALLKPGEEVAFDFRLPIIEISDISSVIGQDPTITTTASVKIKKEGEEKILSSNTVANALNSDFSFTASGRYFSAENLPLGVGPLPPEVGTPTSFRIFLAVTNTLHELGGVSLTASLGEKVQNISRFTSDAGEIRYDPASSQVLWTLNRIPKGVSKVEASFEVTILPKEDDAGKLLVLVASSKAQASDQKTGGEMRLRQGLITSNLDDDPFAKGKGVVIKK